MDCVSHMDSSKYVISLDNLDMGLLPTYTARSNSTSLWTANLNNNPEDYFEFHIKPITETDVFEDDESVNNESTDSIKEYQSNVSTPKSIQRKDTATTCHICDIDLPAAYLAEHENSLKHKAYVKITDVVLSRASKHILKKNYGFVQKNHATYFCGPCASEVKLDDKYVHEKSKIHKKSVSLDRLLYELAMLFTDHEFEDTCEYNKIFDDVNLSKNEIINEVKDNTVVISDTVARLKEFEIKRIENGMKTVYESDLDNLCIKTDIELAPQDLEVNENKLGTIQKDPIINENNQDMDTKTNIINHNGIGKETGDRNLCDTGSNQLLQSITSARSKSNAKTKSDSFTKIDCNTYLCNACNIEMNVNSVISHTIGSKHVMASKSNLHYNMMKGVETVELLCRVCYVHVADDVYEVKAHVETNDHTQKYKDLLANNHIIKRESNFYCKPCDVVVLKRNELFHIEKLKHKNKLSYFEEFLINPQNNNINKADSNTDLHAVGNSSYETNLNTNINKPISSDSKPTITTAYFCDICKVNVPNNPRNINDHIQGCKHKTNALKTEEEVEDSIEDSDTDCLEVHCHMDATDNEKTLMCKVCKVSVPNLEVNINEHVKGKKHDVGFVSIMDANHIEFADEKYFCKKCKVNIKARNVFKHINQKKHLALLAYVVKPETANATESLDLSAKANTIDKETDNNTLDVIKEPVDSLYLRFKNHFVESDDKKRLKCKICFDMDIPSTPETVANHVGSKTHMEGFKNMLSSNLIFETEDGKYFCAICVCLVPSRGEVQHANGMKHAQNFSKLISNEKCHICDEDTTVTNMSEHVMSPEHVTNLFISQTLLQYCQFCKLLFSEEKAEQHEKNCHKFAVKYKICYCTTCDPYLRQSK